LTDALREAALQGHELALPAEGLADISRAQGRDQISEWLRLTRPEATPEYIAARAEHFWRLGHELLPEDSVIVRTREGSAYLIGEVAGSYRRESRAQGMAHIWPVRWRAAEVPADTVPALAQYAGYAGITEVTDESALASLKPYIPALRKGNAGFFKWLVIIILVFELIYFWPRE
jgi:predicted Mrr-cat superfamily restriction endonuclease